MKLKIAATALLFFSLAAFGPALADEMGGLPAPVANLATLQVPPPIEQSRETVRQFDARLKDTPGILSDQFEMGNLDPDQYATDLSIVYGIINAERQLRAEQGGFLGTDQLDRDDLEQVDEQLDRISFN